MEFQQLFKARKIKIEDLSKKISFLKKQHFLSHQTWALGQRWQSGIEKKECTLELQKHKNKKTDPIFIHRFKDR